MRSFHPRMLGIMLICLGAGILVACFFPLWFACVVLAAVIIAAGLIILKGRC